MADSMVFSKAATAGATACRRRTWVSGAWAMRQSAGPPS